MFPQIRQPQAADRPAWLRMRNALWPQAAAEHEGAIDAYLAGKSPDIDHALVYDFGDGAAVGFVEIRVRNYAPGSDRTAVPFVEGWYVAAEHRGRGVGAALMEHAERWAKRAGYSELGSDAEIDNAVSIAAHLALGFEETDRVVSFLKRL